MEQIVKKDAQSLLSWMRERLDDIPDNMIFRQAAIDQMIFFRDHIGNLFNDDLKYEDRQHFVKIESFHNSKSIRLPVYRITTDCIDIVARDNFYNWNVTIVSKIPIELPSYFCIDSGKGYLYLEGMSGWERPLYQDNKKEFTFCVWERHKFYAIMWFISCFIRDSIKHAF